MAHRPRDRLHARLIDDSRGPGPARAGGPGLVVNAIRKRDPVPELNCAEHVWLEKELTSTANVTRRDAQEFLPLAAGIPIVPEVRTFGLEEANEALVLVKQGKIDAAAVLTMTR